jgi:DNA processing protein
MKDKEYSAFMLLNAPGFGVKSIYYIYDNLKKLGLSINELFEQSPTQLSKYLPEIGRGKFSRADLTTLQSLDYDSLNTSYQKLKDENIHIIGLDDGRYPINVAERLGENAPPVLFCKGYLPLLSSDSISIVGSRDVSDFAVMITKRIASRLADSGYNVTSGFAKGVDASSHIGALESNGTTTMVLSYGFNHLSIKKDIKEYDLERNALIISQFLPYEKFSGQNAMSRNKLVCALSKAVIVISSGPERDSSGKMSGTFDAGLTAIRYKIPLFVLNPSLLTPTPKGNIDLINIGGIPLSNGNELVDYLGNLNNSKIEILEVIPQIVDEPQTDNQIINDDIKEKVLSAFNGKPLTVKEIKEQTHLNWTVKKLSAYLKKIDEIEMFKKGRQNLYIKKDSQRQTRLFDL